jgi:uncharacterized protein YjeT (DUF2065 family)
LRIIELLTGCFFLFIGFGYLYYPQKIQRINSWIRDNICNDRLLLSHRRKAGVVIVFAGLIVVYFAIK